MTANAETRTGIIFSFLPVIRENDMHIVVSMNVPSFYNSWQSRVIPIEQFQHFFNEVMKKLGAHNGLAYILGNPENDPDEKEEKCEAPDLD